MFATINGISRNRAQTMASTVPRRESVHREHEHRHRKEQKTRRNRRPIVDHYGDNDQRVMEKDNQILPDDPQDVHG